MTDPESRTPDGPDEAPLPQKTDPSREPPPAAAGPPLAPPDAARPGAESRKSVRMALDREVHDRLTIFVVRALFFIVSCGIGLYCHYNFGTEPVITILISCGIALVVIAGEIFFSKAPVRTLSAITFGLIMGLILSAVLQPVMELLVQGNAPADLDSSNTKLLLQFLRIISTTLFCYFGVTVLLQTKDDFKFIIPYVEFRREVKGKAPLILDTSAIIDGRIQAFLATGVLDQRIAVPKFVFDELQSIADSSDRSRRERGRRGMDMLDQVCREFNAEILESVVPKVADVDAALLEMVSAAGGRLVTTDYNLQKRAKLQGITAINMNDLAAALKPAVVPGEALRVKIIRPGEDPGQGVGFLNDGTMVVVENGIRRIGQEVTLEVTSSIQTSAGKMIFGRLRKAPPQRPGREDQPPARGMEPRGEENQR